MNAQQRTLDDLKIGVNIQIGKSGNIRFRMQPQMGLPSVDIIDKAEVAKLERMARAVKSFTDYFSPFGLNREEQEIWDNFENAFKEVEHMFDEETK